MLYLIIGIFALAAVLGVVLLRSLIIAQRPPRPAVYIHGVLAAAGLGLLIYYAVKQAEGNKLTTAIVFFVIAALGGFTLFFRDLSKKLGPVWLAIVHALVAVTGFAILLLQIL